MRVTRLRQVVVAAHDLNATIDALRTTFGLGEAFPDPGVGEFGLANGVLPVGDQFVEVVSPIGDGSAAQRWMDRCGGDAGYMVIFQVSSMADARAHFVREGLRTVWSADLSDISGTHVHPADIGGAIVSFDEPRPPASWRWAGPHWETNRRTDVVSGVAGITMAAKDPTALLASWSRATSVAAQANSLTLDDGCTVTFVEAADERDALVGIDVTATDRGRIGDEFRIAGTTFRLV